jgi:very-short-patch-repair endonuclease
MFNTTTPAIQQKIKQWQTRLADMSKRNRLLYFRKDKLSTVEILTPALNVFNALATEQSSLPINTLMTRQNGAELVKYLKKLRLTANSMLEERGINCLFVAIGTLTWFDITAGKQQDPFTSPILLMPVKLRKEPKKEEYTLQPSGEDVSFNPILVQKLREDFGILLPESEAIQDFTYTALLDIIRNAIAERLNWKVEETAYIGLFSYAKAVMIQDLIQNEELIATHPILQAFAGDLTAYQSDIPETINEIELDTRLNPQLLFQVLESDSSQQVVIEAAKAGLSFVVQGPPGTGKSQTITNIIAELIGMGKHVLLVSEKETALKVVSDRLKGCGLEDACLNLHHQGTTDKKVLIDNLMTTANRLTKQKNSQDQDFFFHELRRHRKTLNDHSTRLHTKQEPIGKSAFDLYGELLKRAEVPTLAFTLPNFTEWNSLHLAQAKDLLSELGQFLPFLREEKMTVWSKSRLTSYSFEIRMKLLKGVDDLRSGIKRARQSGVRLAELLKEQNPETLVALDALVEASAHVASVPRVPQGWPQRTDISRLQNLLSNLISEVEAVQSRARALDTKYSSEFFASDLSELVARYQGYTGIFRIFQGSYRRDRKQMLMFRKVATRISDKELMKDLEQVDKLQSLKANLAETTHPSRQAFGLLFNSDMPNLEGITQALNWLVELQRYKLSSVAVAEIISSRNYLEELKKVLVDLKISRYEIMEGFDFIQLYFDRNVISGGIESLNDVELERLENFLDIAQSDLDLFQDWLEYRRLVEQIQALGASVFLSKIRESNLQPKMWFPILEKGVYELWLEYIHTNNPELKKFTPELHEQVVQDFAKLDFQQYQVARERLGEIYAKRWQNWSEKATSQLELQLLRKESTKQKRHLQIRQMLKRAPGLVTVLKPCWLMSPLAVSQYVDPGTIRFDVVLFDEASQVRTEDAVPSIMRSAQVIIVGDNKQLPPTSFFAAAASDEEDEDSDEGVYESVLDECWTFMNIRTLKWHYRSQDESLIAFSNRHFYDSHLVTFPNALQDKNRGVKFHYVPDGIYDHGGRRDNKREAETIAHMALEHLQSTPDLSLGIIGFSSAQTDAIREQLELLGNKYPDLAAFCQDNSPQFFLKPLELVQGDERDVIMLSVGYASDSHGVLRYNFGPLNRKGGERRLNVAITRAKCKLLLVSSIQASDLDLGRTNSRAVALLKGYLSYAASGGQKLEENQYSGELHFDSPFEEDVYLALRERGYTVRSQIGCSTYRIDLAVIDDCRPGEFLLGIECDGATYHSSATARDRDRLRQKVLEGLGWRIHRIWSREWFRNKPGQVERLVARLEQLCTRSQAQATEFSLVNQIKTDGIN